MLDTLRFASWNIETLTSKSLELVKVLHKCKVNIACIQKTKWLEPKLVKSIGIICSIPGVQELEIEFVFWLIRSWLLEF